MICMGLFRQVPAGRVGNLKLYQFVLIPVSKKWVGIIFLPFALLLIPQSAYSFPFKQTPSSMASWLNTLRFSQDPTFRVRIHDLYSCERREFRGPSPIMGGYSDQGYINCRAYADISDGQYSGTTCPSQVRIEYNLSTVPTGASIKMDNEYCYKTQTLVWQ